MVIKGILKSILDVDRALSRYTAPTEFNRSRDHVELFRKIEDVVGCTDQEVARLFADYCERYSPGVDVDDESMILMKRIVDFRPSLVNHLKKI